MIILILRLFEHEGRRDFHEPVVFLLLKDFGRFPQDDEDLHSVRPQLIEANLTDVFKPDIHLERLFVTAVNARLLKFDVERVILQELNLSFAEFSKVRDKFAWCVSYL